MFWRYFLSEMFMLPVYLTSHSPQQEMQIELTTDIIVKCLECTGHFQGNETCQELKALNSITNDIDLAEEESSGFCQTYNRCVEEYCPRECWKQQDEWLECAIVELNCDWRCPSDDDELGTAFRAGSLTSVASRLEGNMLIRLVAGTLLISMVLLSRV